MSIFEKSVEIASAMYPNDFGDRRCFHVSFLYNKNKLICCAENSAKTSPRNRYNSKWDLGIKGMCSELRVFLMAKNKFENLDWARTTLVNIRIGKDGTIKNSRPCASCRSLIVGYLGMKKIFFSNDLGQFEKFA